MQESRAGTAVASTRPSSSAMPAFWDDELGAAMRQERRAVHEEGVVEALLEDLRRGEGGR
ncbi:DUF2399 domain-containing protein [Sorangium sp. So ce590]|uniref:DUF2399 domain-containing protein n=1 Tax=Sorangium sp. So ce590 TaxID=3133317 RepID=UPI003F6341D8